MSKLYAFLHPKTEGLAKDIVVSDRFADEEGNVQPFSIKALTQEDNDRITRLSMKKHPKGKKSWIPWNTAEGWLLRELPSPIFGIRNWLYSMELWILWKCLGKCCWAANTKSS